jgi:beta-lactamase class A
MSLGDEIAALCKAFSGRAGVCAENLATRERIEVRANESFPTASAVKVFVLFALHRSELDLDERFEITREHHVLGSGVLSHLAPGLRPTLADLGVLMMMVSDNSATNRLIERLGAERINTAIAEAGLASTHLYGRIDFSKSGTPEGALGASTPGDFVRFYSALIQGKLLDEERTERVLDVLRIQKYIEPLRRELPADPYAREFDEDEPVWVASKTGSMSGLRAEAGIVHTPKASWSIAVMTERGTDARVTADNEGVRLIARASRVIYDAWS